MKYNAVLLDLDGTVIDSADAIILCYGETLNRWGLPAKTPWEIRGMIGPRVRDVLEEQFGLTPAQADEAEVFYHRTFIQVSARTLKLYPGMGELIRDLHTAGIKLCSASLRTATESAFIVEQQGLAPYFTAFSGHDRARDITTKKEIILDVLKKAGEGDCTRAVMIGDTDKDALGAAEAGVAFIAAEYGFGFPRPEEPACYHPVCAARSVEDIRRFLLG